MLQDNQWLGKIGITFSELVLKNRHLRVLATQAQHCRSSYVGMMDVSGQKACQSSGVFASAAAAALMREKFNTIDVLKNTTLMISVGRLGPCPAYILNLAFAILPNQLGNLLAIDLWSTKAELLLKGLLHYSDVSVLAEDQRKHQPVIARPNLPVVSAIAQKRLLPPM